MLEGELVWAAVGVVAGVEARRSVGPGDVELWLRWLRWLKTRSQLIVKSNSGT